MSYRPERLAELIKKEISDILRNEIKDPRIGFLTFTDVEVSGDLRYSKVYCSVFGSLEEQKSTLEVLKKAKAFIRSELGQRLHLRYIPEITFLLDTSLSRGARIMKILGEIKEQEESDG